MYPSQFESGNTDVSSSSGLGQPEAAWQTLKLTRDRINPLSVSHCDESLDGWRWTEYLVVTQIGTAGIEDQQE